MGAFLFEWWEKALIFLIFVGLLLLVSIAVYRLALGAVTHQRWHTRTTHAEVNAMASSPFDSCCLDPLNSAFAALCGARRAGKLAK